MRSRTTERSLSLKKCTWSRSDTIRSAGRDSTRLLVEPIMVLGKDWQRLSDWINLPISNFSMLERLPSEVGCEFFYKILNEVHNWVGRICYIWIKNRNSRFESAGRWVSPDCSCIMSIFGREGTIGQRLLPEDYTFVDDSNRKIHRSLLFFLRALIPNLMLDIEVDTLIHAKL